MKLILIILVKADEENLDINKKKGKSRKELDLRKKAPTG